MTSIDDRPSLGTLFRVFGKIGCISFGGPAGQIALMHDELVERRRWIAEDDFLLALNFCHLLPGPEAQQLATYIGWKLHGVRGGLMAGLLFILPGAAIMLGLSILYVGAVGLPWFDAAFMGVKAAVIAIIAQALLRIGGRSLDTRFKCWLAALSFLLILLVNMPFPAIVAGAAVAGVAMSLWRPRWLAIAPVDASSAPRPRWTRTVATVGLWLALWAAPVILVALMLGPEHRLIEIARFFSKLAVVTFGGAYAVLGYMAQQSVNDLGWISAGEMADGLGLAETTPGPLIMVTQFVGYLAGARAAAPLSPLMGGIAGAMLTTWVTFAPCFLWILSLAPWIDRLRGAVRLRAAMAAITAAIVGVIAHLGVWFAAHTLFASTGRVVLGPVALDYPLLASIDYRAVALAGVAGLCLMVWKQSVLRTLLISAAAGLAFSTHS